MNETAFDPEPGWRPTEVHPAANAFPMIPDDELAALADDIKANGLLHPIVIDGDGVLLDGRNRLRACDIAGVEPEFSTLNGYDPRRLIVSANLTRRNLTKGQQAMALAMIYPEPEKGGRGKVSEARKVQVSSGFSRERLDAARAVLRHSRSLADAVKAGLKSLDEALKVMSDEQELSANVETMMADLRDNAPDLADLVTEERLTLGEAHTAYKKRRADAETTETNKREVMLRLSETAWRGTTAWASGEFVDGINARLRDPAFRKAWFERLRLDPERLSDIERGAKAFAAVVSRMVKERGDV